MKQKYVLAFAIMSFLICGCNGCAAVEKEIDNENAAKVITIVSWNTQEFFDSQKEGSEYSEYQSAKNWSEEKYLARLERLCSVISELNADIYVLEEIENEAIIQDMANQMIGDSWKASERLMYSCFTKIPKTATGVAILSRYPLENIKAHALDIRTQESEQPTMRPILEATVNVGEKKFTIFGNHWKSKSGGEEKSEIWRDWQESLLAGFLIEGQKNSPEYAAILCGDFNRDISEFIKTSEKKNSGNKIILRNAGFGETQKIVVNNAWLTFGNKIGSYYFNESWEKIDHIMCFGKAKITGFTPKTGEWADESGKPKEYKIFSGEGYSDHLPIFATVVYN